MDPSVGFDGLATVARRDRQHVKMCGLHDGEIRRQTELDWEMLSTRDSKVISNVESKLKLLTEVRDDVEECGYVSGALQKHLESLFGKDDSLVADCREISQVAQEEQDLSAELELPQDGGRDGDPGPEPAEGNDSIAEDSSIVDYKRDLLLLITIRAAILKK